MAKTDVNVNPGDRPNAIRIILDKIGDVFWPIYKIAFGAEGSATCVDADNPLPVELKNIKNFILEVARGNVPGHSIVNKFGHAIVTTDILPITNDLSYETPLSPVSLEFVSDSADDATGGAGATKITYEGIDSNWDFIMREIDTDGTTPVPLPDGLLRLTRWYVSESGTYANPFASSYVGNLQIRVAGAGATWSTIAGVAPFPGQSEIGVHTIPKNHTAYVISKHIFTDTSKTANVYFLSRQHADDVAAPYAGVRRLLEREVGLSGPTNVVFEALKGPIIGPADIGFVGNVISQTASVSVEFDLILIEDGY